MEPIATGKRPVSNAFVLRYHLQTQQQPGTLPLDTARLIPIPNIRYIALALAALSITYRTSQEPTRF